MNRRHRRSTTSRRVAFAIAPERQRIELAGHDDRAAGRERRQRRRHQAVHVKQRHHAHRHVVGRSARNAARRSAPKSRDSRASAARASAGRCCRWCAASSATSSSDGGGKRTAVGDAPSSDTRPERIHVDRQHRDAFARGAACFFSAVRRQHQDFRVRVLEVEPEFLFLVRRVQRRGRARHRRGEKRDDHRQAVRQRDADAVAAADPCGGERLGKRVPPAREARGNRGGGSASGSTTAVLASGARRIRSSRVDGVEWLPVMISS